VCIARHQKCERFRPSKGKRTSDVARNKPRQGFGILSGFCLTGVCAGGRHDTGCEVNSGTEQWFL
jgi:hypothetical protein